MVKLSSKGILLCLVAVILVQSTMSDTNTDTGHSRQKRSIIGDLVNQLTKSVSKSLASIFDLDPEEFEEFLGALGRLGLSLARKALNQFQDKMDAQFDFGSDQNSQRVAMMMKALEQNINDQEIGTTMDTMESTGTSARTTLSPGSLSLVSALLFSFLMRCM